MIDSLRRVHVSIRPIEDDSPVSLAEDKDEEHCDVGGVWLHGKAHHMEVSLQSRSLTRQDIPTGADCAVTVRFSLGNYMLELHLTLDAFRALCQVFNEWEPEITKLYEYSRIHYAGPKTTHLLLHA